MNSMNTTNTTARRVDIDWLRIGATYLLFIFHVAKVFDQAPFYQIKNGELSGTLNLFTGFIHQWHMPLFFTLAGWSLFASIKKRGPRGMIGERFKRIFIPFLLGCLIICPPMQYFYAREFLGFTGSFLEFLPHFFTSITYFSWSHLWFLIYLFTFTFLYLPLFTWLLRKDLTRISSSRVLVYLPVIIFITIQVLLRERWPGWQNLFNDWANFSYYSSFFIIGFLLSAVPTYEKAVHREMVPSFIIALAALIIMGFTPVWTITKLGLACSALAGYFMVIGLLGLGNRLLQTSSPILSYFAESAYPVYILHQFFIVMPGYYIIQLNIPIPVKFILVLVIAVLGVMILYHLVVRRFAIARFCFGMKGRISQSIDRRGTLKMNVERS